MKASTHLASDGSLDALPRTSTELARGVESGLHFGGQLYVSRGGEVVADAAFGLARPYLAERSNMRPYLAARSDTRPSPAEPMTRAHRMLWMSSTKPFAAVAVAQLWERGALGLDDAVARHLPEFAQGGKEAVTIRHLLTHTGGIRMLDVGWPELAWEAIVAKICARRLEPRWTPGRKAGYHLASSWFVLGELVRRLDGRPFERYVRAEILEPIGAADSWIGMPVEVYRESASRIAPMYENDPQRSSGPRAGSAPSDDPFAGARPLDATSEQRIVRANPGANGCGPVRELARLYEALLAGGARDGRRILAPQTVEALTARHRVGLVDQTFRARLDWGLGVIVNSAHYGEPEVPYGYGPHAGPRTYGHSGARSSTAFCDPDADLVVATAVNGLPDDDAHRRRFERLTAAVYEDLGLAVPATMNDA